MITLPSIDTSQTKKLGIILESRRDALSKSVHNRNSIAVENTADTMDEVRLAEERDLATRLLERDFAEIRLVDAALTRIKKGTYGLCVRCDETISLNRLRAIPHAAYCVNCQETLERDEASGGNLHEVVTGVLVGQ
jgi:DnaK suppressor protein